MAIGKKVYEIWTVFVEGDIRDSIPLVIIHGMGGGTNMFLNNIDDLAEEVYKKYHFWLNATSVKIK